MTQWKNFGTIRRRFHKTTCGRAEKSIDVFIVIRKTLDKDFEMEKITRV